MIVYILFLDYEIRMNHDVDKDQFVRVGAKLVVGGVAAQPGVRPVLWLHRRPPCHAKARP